MQRTNTTNRRRQEGSSAAVAPKFITTITSRETNKLRVPDEIMARYGHNLPNRVWCLNVPIGLTWRVELVQSANGETWLNNGWQEFKEYYSLTCGQSLLFKYKGNSHFNVLIFDSISCEIDYPLAAIDDDKDINAKTSERQVSEADDVGSESDDSVMFVNEKKGSNTEKRKRLNECSDNCKVKKLVRDTMQEVLKGKNSSKPTYGLVSQKMKSKIKSHTKAAMTSVNDSASTQFEIVLQEYQKSRVVLRKKFGENLHGKATVIMEYAPTRGSKKVLLETRPIGNQAVRYELASGWNDFREENGLEFWKSYLFMYNRERNVISVSPVEKELRVNMQGKDNMKLVRRKSGTRSDRCNLDPESSNARIKRKYAEVSDSEGDDDADDDSNEDQPVENHGCVKNKDAMTSVFDKSSPQYEMVLMDYQKYRVVLDREFAKNADLFSKEAVFLKYEPTRQCTEVLLDDCSRKHDTFRLELATGWKDFRKRNELKVGKTYSFVYNRGRNVILVRPVEEKLRDNAQREKKKKRRARNLGDYAEELFAKDDNDDDEEEGSEDQDVEMDGNVNNKAAMPVTSALDNSSPQLEIFLMKNQRSRVVLRKEFGKHLIRKKFVIVEYKPTQRSKKVMLYDRTRQCKGFRLDLALGWNDFCKENDVEFGKSYLFVYNRERDVIQVSPVEEDVQVTVKGKDKMKDITKKFVTRSGRFNLDPESSSARKKRKYSLEDDYDDDWSEDQLFEVHGKCVEENVSDDSDDDSTEVKIAEKCIKVKVTKERRQTVMHKETSIAYQNAKSFKSNIPFFISLMHPSYVSDKFVFGIPTAFAKENLPKECVEVKLHVPNGGIWNVRCVFRLKRANLTGGWGKFAKDNNLKVGDVCVFEAIEKLLWNVIIYRG